MQLPGLCRECGRTIAKDFVFCPWCGVSQVTGELVPVGAPRRKRAGSAAADVPEYGESNRLKNITQQLDDLEKEFTIFAMRQERDYL